MPVLPPEQAEIDRLALAHLPVHVMPPSGINAAIETVRGARSGQALALGSDGLWFIARRPWLELDAPLSAALPVDSPFGLAGPPRLLLRCGGVPASITAAVVAHLARALPNEAACFVIWNEENGQFALLAADVTAATPVSIAYNRPRLALHEHLVLDIHSHGHGRAFFSPTDDHDDMTDTKIALVLGDFNDASRPGSWTGRICASGTGWPLGACPLDGLDALMRPRDDTPFRRLP